jgi:MFS superfamily sulfate permease-like transporter
LLIWRAGGELFFASIGHLDQGLKAALAANRPPAKHVLLDADSVNFIDTSACDALLNSIKESQSQGTTFALAGGFEGRPRFHLRQNQNNLDACWQINNLQRGAPPKIGFAARLRAIGIANPLPSSAPIRG